MPEIKKTFSANLRKLTKSESSIAHVCRETSINRQQFNRYIAGKTLPSEENIRKIANYFKISEVCLFKENSSVESSVVKPNAFFESLNNAFETLQEHIIDGRYYFYLPSPGSGEHCLRGLFVLERKEERLRVTGCICATCLAEPTKFNSFSRFEGLARELDGHVTIMCSFSDKAGDFMMFNLMPVPTGHSQFFSGICTSTRSGMVLARRIAIERVSDDKGLLALVRKCGSISLDNADIDPWVRAAIGSDEGDWAVFMQPKPFSAIVNNFTGDRPSVL